MLLDLRLPDIPGFDVCRTIRAKSIVPIIIVTAQTDTLRPRRRARGRRRRLRHQAGRAQGAGGPHPGPAAPGPAARDHRRPGRPCSATSSCAASRASSLKRGDELPLTKTEFRLLCEFADHAGMVLSRDQLLERVWGYDYLGDSRLVDAHVRRLRVKIEDHPDEPKLIVTVRGIGYRLQVA